MNEWAPIPDGQYSAPSRSQYGTTSTGNGDGTTSTGNGDGAGFNATQFSEILGASMTGLGALIGGIGQMAGAVKDSGGNPDEVTEDQLITGLNLVAQGSAATQQGQADEIKALKAEIAALSQDIKAGQSNVDTSDEGISPALAVGLALGGVAVLGGLFLLARR